MSVHVPQDSATPVVINTAADTAQTLIEDGYITCSFRIARTFGINEAILLEYLMSWGAGKYQQWAFRTSLEIELDTCLTRHQQETARKHLREIGVLEEKREGIPPRLYFHVHWDQVEVQMEHTPRKGQPDWTEEHQEGSVDDRHSYFRKTACILPENGIRMPKTDITIKEVSKRSSNVEKSNNARGVPRPEKPSDALPDFALFYQPYPKHEGVSQARVTWGKLTKDRRMNAIKVLHHWLKAKKFSDDPKFVALPSTWLNKYAADEVDDPKTSVVETTTRLEQLEARLALCDHPESWSDDWKQEDHRNTILGKPKGLFALERRELIFAAIAEEKRRLE